MKKAADAFRSIGEVSQLVGVAPHVLRYWESQFPLFTPVKRRDGRRYYRPDDIRIAAGLCEMLREEGMSIRGAKSQMASDRGAAVKARGAARLGGDFDVGATAAESVASGKTRQSAKPRRVVTTRKAKAEEPASAIAAPSAAAAHKPTGPAKTPLPTHLSERQRKEDDMTDSLPLFPELGGPEPGGNEKKSAASAADGRPPGEAAASTAPPAEQATQAPDSVRDATAAEVAPSVVPPVSDPSGSEWLGRLVNISSGLRMISAMPEDSAQTTHDRIAQARQTLAA